MAGSSEDKVIEKYEIAAAVKKPTECPMCGTKVPEDADECPSCEEPFTPEAFEKKLKQEFKIHKWRFIAGVILVLIGGPGIASMSALQAQLGLVWGEYDNLESFGWVNQLVATVGIIILVIGIILLILSLPNPKKSPEEEDDGEKEADEGG